TPVLVAGLGSSLYGVWQMLSRLVTYMQAADGRPTQALKWVIANRQASDDAEEKRRHVGSALGVWLLFLPVLAALSVALVWGAPYVTKVPAELYGTVRVTCALLVVNFLLTNLVVLPEAVLRGMNLGYRRMGLQAGLSVVGGALAVGALYAGGGLAGLAAAQVLLAAITGALFLVLVKRFVPWFGVSRPSFAEVRSFLRLSVWWFAWSLINKLLLASDILVLGFAASAAAVTTYSLTNFAASTLLSLATTVAGAVTPGLGGVIGQKQYEKAAALRGEMLSVSWLLLTTVGAVILLCNRSFVSLWVGAEHYAGTWANLLVVVMCVQFMFIRNDAFVIDLTLELREKVTTGAASAVLSLALSALLIPRLGIAGLCLGMIAGRTVLTVSYPFIVNARLGGGGRVNLRAAVRPALTTLALFAAATYLGHTLTVDNWLAWAACACASACLAFGAAWAAGLDAGARAKLAGRLSMLRTLRGGR
ncbi:MAG TPA: oligosaccharide flippase family protein, partial [Pyrinomonadaceae bacterium]|nr:oligosaccharide flippase family protein [Pyrinomonadaceae bacterium]